MQKSYSVSDIATAAHLGIRFGEPFLNYARGEYTPEQVQQELTYRFGGIAADGSLALGGVAYTYGPPIIMQVLKKGVRRLMGKSIRIGPLRLP